MTFSARDLHEASVAHTMDGKVVIAGSLTDSTFFLGTDCIEWESNPLFNGPAPVEVTENPPEAVTLTVLSSPTAPRQEVLYELPEPGPARLTVFDVTGRWVAELLDARLGSGAQTVVWDADRVPSGIYFYRLETQAGTLTQKTLLIR